MRPIRRFVLPTLIAAALAGAGCERLGLQDPGRIAAEQEAEGKAVGAGCRHAGRSLEDCYAMNEDALKAAVFTGWREMNDYMAANNIAVVPPQAAAEAAPAKVAGTSPAAAAENSEAAAKH